MKLTILKEELKKCKACGKGIRLNLTIVENDNEINRDLTGINTCGVSFSFQAIQPLFWSGMILFIR